MMMDNLDPREHVAPATGVTPAAQADEEMALDREIPRGSRTSAAVHAWLDGESVGEAQLAAADREVALWRQIDQEAGRRRRMTTPTTLTDRIIAAIPKGSR
ncbi:MAG: hypothetical protein K2X99_00720 [Gemmatimonadaceae bacterium]|nr:hypothetical protein [Gemmatimonadaceae bacterium]